MGTHSDADLVFLPRTHHASRSSLSSDSFDKGIRCRERSLEPRISRSGATVIRYFCDWCGRETSEDEVRIAWVIVPPDPAISMEVCPECARNAATIVLSREPVVHPVIKRRRLSRRKSVPELVRGDGEEDR
jgi:hypothetical protein